MTETTPEADGPELSPLLTRALELLGDRVLAYHSQHGDDTIVVAADQRLDVANVLRHDEALHFDMLMDSTAVDWDEEEPRFELVDHFFSTTKHHRLRMKCRVEEDAAAPSLVPLFGSANWMERETYDMYGITFDGHPDMRRILLYPQFQGFPLRKDYDKLQAWPLFEERYSGVRETARIIHPNPGEQEPNHEP